MMYGQGGFHGGGGAPGQPYRGHAPGTGASMGPPGAMPPGLMPHSPAFSYRGSRGALTGAKTAMKIVHVILIGTGVLIMVVGVVLCFVVHIGIGISVAVTGLMMLGFDLLMLPLFGRVLGSASDKLDALAAKDQLAMTGVPAWGRIVQIQQTGTTINDSPEVLAYLQVQHPQHGVYSVQTKALLPLIAIPRFQPGAQVQVRINPGDPHDVALVV